MHLGWQVLEQKSEGLVHRSGINTVVVVKDQDEMIRDSGDVIEQSSQNRFGWRWLRRLKHPQHPCANRRRNRLQCGDEVGQKACGVVLAVVEREPGDFER